MTIKKQLARSHIAMVLIPVLAAGALLVLGLGLTLVLLDRVYLPRLFDPFYRGDAAHPKLLQTVWGVGYRLGRTAR